MSEKRKAKNEALFREVNERIQDVATELAVPDEARFICECGDAGCTERMNLTLAEYESVRVRAPRFAILPGHEDPEVERVLLRNDRYAVVEKFGTAAMVVDALDPRD